MELDDAAQTSLKAEPDFPSEVQAEAEAIAAIESDKAKRRSPSAPRRYRCQDCPPGSNAFDNGFRQKKQLAAHRAVVHKASSLCLPCPHPGCHKLFVCQSKLDIHQRMHASRPCPECDAEFVGYSALRRHRALEHPPEIDCPQCGVRLTCRALLKNHLTTAHCPPSAGDSSAVPSHACPYDGCGKAYTLARNLQQHIRSRHLGVRFPCPRPGCTYSLCTQQKLRLHLVLHDQGRLMPPPRLDRKKLKSPSQDPQRHSSSRIGLLASESRQRRKRQTPVKLASDRQRLDSNASSIESNGAGNESDNSLVRLLA